MQEDVIQKRKEYLYARGCHTKTQGVFISAIHELVNILPASAERCEILLAF